MHPAFTEIRPNVGELLKLIGLYFVFSVITLVLQHQAWPAALSPELAQQPLRYPDLQAVLGLSGLWAVSMITVFLAAAIAPEASRALSDRLSDALHQRGSLWLVTVVLASVFLPLLIAVFALDRFANSADEYAYMIQATFLAQGDFWLPALPLGEAFVPFRTFVNGDQWTSQYPPGWPLALALGLLVGLPLWAVNGPLGGVGVAGLACPVWPIADRRVLVAVATFYALTPFYVFNAASYHSHTFSALLIVLLCLFCLRYNETRGWPCLVVIGIAFGLLALSRHISALLLVPALLYWLVVNNPGRWLRIGSVLGLVGLPFLGFLMLYQDSVTGSPFKTSYSVINVKELSFLTLAPEDLILGTKITFFRLVELGLWVSPLLVTMYAAALIAKIRSRSLAFYDLIFPSFVIGFFFFPSLGGNRYGPRYYYEAFPLMLITMGTALPSLREWLRRWRDRRYGVHAVLVTGLYLVTAYPFIISDYHQQLLRRQEVYHLAEAMNLTQAIVLIKSRPDSGFQAKDLVRNGINLNQPILYARGMTPIEELRARFPDRTIWIYERVEEGQPGRLTPALP
jgi:hypothetical protein